MAAFDTPAAIDAYEAALGSHPENPELLRKAASALSNRAEETSGREGDGPLHEKAVRLARKAAGEAPRVARAHATLAVVLGRYGDWLGHERRMAAAATVAALGKEAYQHADRALAIDPDDWVAHAFMGAMHRRLSTLPAVVRQVAETFLRWPDVSLEESEVHLVKAVRLEPNEVTLRFQLAQTYLAMERKADGRRQLEAALAARARDRLDQVQQAEARKLLAELD